MNKKLVLPENDFSSDDDGFVYRRSYESFFDYFKKIVSKEDLESSIQKIEDKREILNAARKQFLSAVREESLLALFLIWSKQNYVKTGYPDYAKILIEKEILIFNDDSGNLLILKNIERKFLVDILESIRCRKDLDLWQREMLVLAYLDFINFSRSVTDYMAFWDIKDLDKERSYKRIFEYDDFIRIIDKLDDKFQLLAKLLYLGGQRTLDQVLTLNVQDIQFERRVVVYGNDQASYSLHVFEDLKAIIGEKKFGRVFLGRQDNPLNAATVFRHFKDGATKARLDPSFSPKTLLLHVD